MRNEKKIIMYNNNAMNVGRNNERKNEVQVHDAMNGCADVFISYSNAVKQMSCHVSPFMCINVMKIMMNNDVWTEGSKKNNVTYDKTNMLMCCVRIIVEMKMMEKVIMWKSACVCMYNMQWGMWMMSGINE